MPVCTCGNTSPYDRRGYMAEGGRNIQLGEPVRAFHPAFPDPCSILTQVTFDSLQLLRLLDDPCQILPCGKDSCPVCISQSWSLYKVSLLATGLVAASVAKTEEFPCRIRIDERYPISPLPELVCPDIAKRCWSILNSAFRQYTMNFSVCGLEVTQRRCSNLLGFAPIITRV